jgi:DNA-binding beta-propeller fold protein YncE
MSPLSSLFLLLHCVLCFSGPQYVQDSSFPQLPKSLSNISRVTAVAVANGTDGSTEVHFAQRGLGEPPIMVFSTSGAYLRAWGEESLESPHGMFAQSGQPSTLWITDIEAATVKQFNISGGLLQSVGTANSGGGGLSPVQFSAPADLYCDPSAVYISDGDGGINNRVLKLSGSNLESVLFHIGGLGTGPGQFNTPHSIAYDSVTSTIWVADRGNKRLQQFDGETGAYINEWASCFSPGIPWGVRIYEAARVMFVADGASDNVYVLSMAGASCTLIQTIPFANNTEPHEMDVDQRTGDLYVAGVGAIPTMAKFVLA